MRLFIDTANIDEIKEIAEWGVIRGVTTNPKICSQEESIDLKTRVKEILAIVPGPLSVEVTSNDLEEMVEEAKVFSSWSEHIVVKLPMSPAGLKACAILSRHGVKTNVTAIMTVNQAVLAANAGATYASIFYSRINDLGEDGLSVIRNASGLFKQSGYQTQIIVGSIRIMSQINEAGLAGADIVTVPYKFFKQMAYHPQTDATIKEFLEAWQTIKSPA